MKVFRRKIYDELLDWKNKWAREYAILLEGARRVGKSTIVEEFAKNEYDSYLIIDFNHVNKDVLSVFEKYNHDIDKLLSVLQIVCNVRLIWGKSLIVFDEVQKYPQARGLIKYLVKDGRFDYIETGSLITLKQNTRDIQIPSEEMHLRMFPMDFEEWCWACGFEEMPSIIREAYDKREPLMELVHRSVMEQFKTYMLTGGMPQAVSKYTETHDMVSVETVKKVILDLYRDDMYKIGGSAGAKAKAVFEEIPSILSTHRKNFRPGLIKKNTRQTYFASGIEWLTSARICEKCRITMDPDISGNLNNGEPFKCYLLDTGLLMTLAFDGGVLSMPEVYSAFTRGKLSVNEGMLFENVVAQLLRSSGKELHYIEFREKENAKNVYEIDFILSKGKKITPVEVKSSVSSKHRSLDIFVEKYSKRIEQPVVVHSKNLRIDNNILYIPIYMVHLL
ncbi:MAG: AAA family ATPase [archaeon]|nr:AAA family ATPase [archaeon]